MVEIIDLLLGSLLPMEFTYLPEYVIKILTGIAVFALLAFRIFLYLKK
jgi:hypothetical protein